MAKVTSSLLSVRDTDDRFFLFLACLLLIESLSKRPVFSFVCLFVIFLLHLQTSVGHRSGSVAGRRAARWVHWCLSVCCPFHARTSWQRIHFFAVSNMLFTRLAWCTAVMCSLVLALQDLLHYLCSHSLVSGTVRFFCKASTSQNSTLKLIWYLIRNLHVWLDLIQVLSSLPGKLIKASL